MKSYHLNIKIMKKLFVLLIIVLMTTTLFAQSWNTGLDINSKYVWRGLDYGGTPSYQPHLEFSTGTLDFGTRAYLSNEMNEYSELDVFMDFRSFVSDQNTIIKYSLVYYLFPKNDLHSYNYNFLEPQLKIRRKALSFMGGVMIGLDHQTFDTYLEGGLDLWLLNFVVGFGDGAYTTDGEFRIVNVSLRTEPELLKRGIFVLKALGEYTYNPSIKTSFWSFGFSFNIGDKFGY